MGSTAGIVDGGTIIRAAWHQPGAGKLNESVSNTPGLVLPAGAVWIAIPTPRTRDRKVG